MTVSPTVGSYRRPRRLKYSARPFVTTIAVVFFLASLAWIHHRAQPLLSPESHGSKWKRGVIVEDEECRLVHHAADKCAFVQANCPDEEAGVFSYLSLYYCRLPHAQPLAFLILVIWLALLFSTIGIAASDFFCVNLSTISTLLGMSESMAGVTFLAFGNGSPDVFSTFAAMRTNSGSLAVGELVGAAGFITAVVAGSMALVRPFKVARLSFVRDVGFFIVAASFSMVFLWDGKLYLWECATMVGFYIFYVCFVMVWHWWLGRRKWHRQRVAAIRSQYILPGGEEEEIHEEYHDDDGGYDDARTPTPLTARSTDDFLTLEQSGEDRSSDLEDDEDARERWLGELNSNMRLSRPRLGSRRNTHNPIRPSLVGALEFRAVLSSLKKSRNIQSTQINLRRYSDDPTLNATQQQGLLSTAGSVVSSSAHLLPTASNQSYLGTGSTLEPNKRTGNRIRAVSTNDVDTTQLDPSGFIHRPVPSIDFGPSEPADSQEATSSVEQNVPSHGRTPSPKRNEYTLDNRSPSLDFLAPPGLRIPGAQPAQPGGPSPGTSISPSSEALHRGDRQYPKLIVPGSSPSTPFPPYTDYPASTRSSSRAPSIRLPSPSASPVPFFHDEHFLETEESPKIPKWWPSRVLPAPGTLLCTLFPTLTHWKNKNVWERMLGVVAAPSVFLLTITLPVVEMPKVEDNDYDMSSPSFSLPASITPIANGDAGSRGPVMILEPDGPSNGRSVEGSAARNTTGNKAAVRPYLDSDERSVSSPNYQTDTRPVPNTAFVHSPEQIPTTPQESPELKQWNRWLVIVQAFTAPLFIVLVIWANTEPEYPRALIRPTLYSLIFSLGMLAILVTTTTPSRPPRWRALLCFLGFVVSISWISTIANEVVGVLKTLGVILDMSDAILGLTIFAVGNSLGDLVADITVARLGFPVMALSACFGGPMLNILLGIGISGCYMTIKGGKQNSKHHPDRPSKFKPYHLDISTTLVISGATLLVTLLGLLIAVPMRKWRMDKVIGWSLVALWTISTVLNVVVEVMGWGSSLS